MKFRGIPRQSDYNLKFITHRTLLFFFVENMRLKTFCPLRCFPIYIRAFSRDNKMGQKSHEQITSFMQCKCFRFEKVPHKKKYPTNTIHSGLFHPSQVQNMYTFKNSISLTSSQLRLASLHFTSLHFSPHGPI